MLASWFAVSNCSPSLVATIAITLVIVAIATIYYYLQRKDLPPGPAGLPYFGLWPFLDSKSSHLQLDAYKKKYGDVFSFTSTGRLYINLGTTKAVRDAHITKGDSFAARPQGYSWLSYVFGEGVAFVEGEQWKTLRKFFMNVMRKRGMGALKDNMAGPFYDCINTTIAEIKEKKQGEPIPIIKLLTRKCNTVMRITLFGEVGASEEQIHEITECYEAIMGSLNMPNMLLIGVVAKYFIFPFTHGYRESQDNLRLVEAAIYKVINEHKSTYNQEHLRDIIDDYINERNTRRSKGDPTANHFTDKALMASLLQIIGDGVLSVAAFISLFIKVLLDAPEEQHKIYKELMEVIGPNRQPTMEDKSNLPYTNAFLLEALRISDFFQYFPSLQCTKETTLGGFRIPKGSITLMNMYSAHNDPETYENPEKCDPTRFMALDGKRRPDLPIPFGGGKRSCIGEAFTMTQVFTFLTSLLKSFHFKLPEGTTESTFDLIMSGKLQVIVTPRN